ncbi:hypothetical protein PRZ48_005698 [Zasmidium cellare]|uniref:Arylamine N-acetyltransferase n=1 Tax=Zasmidium cellare TaxID=395010 RepID=A0ABR0EMC3_ZASCE|nr:hypothetical protein PRZ48_005698 [Zasmidium cellare]
MAHKTSPAVPAQTSVPIDPKNRPRYSHEQLQQYFTRINLPEQIRTSPVINDASLAGTEEHGLPLLKALHRHHLANIPFENLELHYSAHKKISLNMDVLFDKFVVRGIKHGRGGRCMENNGFFGTVLRSLGYNVRNCAGRVSRMWNPNAETREQLGETYDGWNHMLNLVKINNQRYIVDVGMGSMGPAIVYPLQDGWEGVAVAPRKIRLQLKAIPETYGQGDDAPKLWCFDQCLVPDAPGKDKWIPTYCFTETEFLPQDYEMMSYFTSNNPSVFFTYCLICTKLLVDEEKEVVVGDVSLFNNGVRKTVGGKRDAPQELKSEEERIQVLKDVFKVELTEEEKNGLPDDKKLN